MSTSYELQPRDGHKSFYGKARVNYPANGIAVLRSYSTDVAACANGKIYRLWDGWSATTGRHIAAFCGLNKAAFEKLPLVSLWDITHGKVA
jgi:hypothetical protein